LTGWSILPGFVKKPLAMNNNALVMPQGLTSLV
jgi:hypothetical protein